MEESSYAAVIEFVVFINLRFNVEKECSKIDEGYEENNSKARFFSRPSPPVIEKKIDTTGNVLETSNFSVIVILCCGV